MFVDMLQDPNVWAAFLTLTALELVLGIDNVIFISILVGKLPPEKRELARRVGLFGAMFMRIGLLMMLAWLVGLTEPIITIMNQSLSGRDLVLLLGGLFSSGKVWVKFTKLWKALMTARGAPSLINLVW